MACPSDTPKCLKANYTVPELWFVGMICINPEASCYNNNELPNPDYKCTAEHPICVKADGSKPTLNSLGDECIVG